jgi:acetyl/propionyl-CoA carboxylase alpha subunit
LDFCRFALQHEAFVSGQFDTKFVEHYFTPEKLEPVFTEQEKEILAALAVEFFEKYDRKINPREAVKSLPTTHWKNRLI